MRVGRGRSELYTMSYRGQYDEITRMVRSRWSRAESRRCARYGRRYAHPVPYHRRRSCSRRRTYTTRSRSRCSTSLVAGAEYGAEVGASSLRLRCLLPAASASRATVRALEAGGARRAHRNNDASDLWYSTSSQA